MSFPPAPRLLRQCRSLRRYSTANRSRPVIAVKHLVSPVPYTAALALQDHLVTLRTQQRLPNILLLLQHPPTFTAGRRVRGTDDTEGVRLRATGAEYYETMRGGQTTFHGPGQLVGYPIFYLPDFGLGVRTYIEQLENVLITALRAYGIAATTTADTGVWVDSSENIGNNSNATNRERKIAALGIQVRRHVSSHGFALNCDTDLSWFEHIVPCGLVGKGVTSISHELELATAAGASASGARTNVTVAHAIPYVVNAFGGVFDSSVSPLAGLDAEADQDIDAFVAAKVASTKNISQTEPTVNNLRTKIK
ncbi:putative lipoyltransferase 2, mitochondrial [Geranomyces variabilis]|uniref:lipoyl(octanoyl) transferase n=1 Tax=Geranomyces variabilis TaxID=109894 RepID=A0AAD5THM4_9FUNG|nr:putative lipoyltransferase 2, mitochondrial [Geranomyces variabilis]